MDNNSKWQKKSTPLLKKFGKKEGEAEELLFALTEMEKGARGKIKMP